MIVSILNQKGGAGKTTIATNLARSFVLSDCGKVLLVDSDPQGSARDWHVCANGELLNVIGLDRPTLEKDIKTASYDYDWVFIDGAPGLTTMAIAAIKSSDIILIPVQPSPYDLWATEDLISLVAERINWTGDKVKAAFIISRKIPNTIISNEIKDILQCYRVSHGIPTFEHGTVQRIIYATSAAMGSTVLEGKDNEAAKEIMNIREELRRFAQ